MDGGEQAGHCQESPSAIKSYEEDMTVLSLKLKSRIGCLAQNFSLSNLAKTCFVVLDGR